MSLPPSPSPEIGTFCGYGHLYPPPPILSSSTNLFSPLRLTCRAKKERCECLKKRPKTCSGNQNKREILQKCIRIGKKLTVLIVFPRELRGYPPELLQVPLFQTGEIGRVSSWVMLSTTTRKSEGCAFSFSEACVKQMEALSASCAFASYLLMKGCTPQKLLFEFSTRSRKIGIKEFTNVK